MNLGEVFIETAFVICLVACLLALSVALILRYMKRTRWFVSLTVFVVLVSVLVGGGLYFGHSPLFAAWHRFRNNVLPRTDCLTYEPSFFRLYATYRMSRAEFDAWIARHPWHLTPCDERQIASQDAEQLGFAQPDAAYASEPAPNGRQLRVYFKNDTMYVSYWAM